MIRNWDAETGSAVSKPLEGHTGYVLFVAYSPNGRHIRSGSRDKDDPNLGSQDGRATQAMCSLSRGRHIISGSGDQKIRNENAETGSAFEGNN